MKKILLLLAINFAFLINAQNAIEKNIGDFKTLKVYDLINLTLIKSNENKVVIYGKNKNDVELVNKSEKLKIRMNLEEGFDGDNTYITLYYKSIDVIDANEGAKITVNNIIEQNTIDIKVQEGAEITVNLKTNYANFRAVTGGIINVNGSSNNQDISIYTGGIFNGKRCISQQTEISIRAAGEAHIYAKEFADVNIKAGGDVYIYGNPKSIDESRMLGGTIKRM